MESAYWRTLVEVARAGSLSGAADRLCVTQSAVSRRVKALEDQYGQELLERTPAGVSLTRAGELVVEKATQILQLEEDLAAGLSPGGRRRQLTFACTPSFGLVHLPRVMREFLLGSDDAVDLSFRFGTPAAIVQGLQSGAYDVAVLEHCDSLQLQGFSATALPADSMVFVSSAGGDLPAGEVAIDRLLEQPLLTRQTGCCSRTLLEQNLAGTGHTLAEFARVVIIDDLRTLVEAVRGGSGLSFLSTDVVAPLLEQEVLRAHRVPGFTHRRRRTLVSSADTGPCPYGGRLKETIVRLFGCEGEVTAVS